MRRYMLCGFLALSAFLLVTLLGGCGSSKKEGGAAVTQVDLVNAAHLGDANCLQCHNAGKDLTMINDLDTRTIGAVWQDSLHFGDINGIQTVHCEDCHGGGQFHWGTGPLAFPVPDYTVCSKCHTGATAENFGLNDKSSFVATAHANTNQIPDNFFFQGGTGTGQATKLGGGAEFVIDQNGNPTSTPVTINQHIEECSVCHNSNQRFVYDTSGNLMKPDPANMPNPTVSCANCHDAHQTGLTADLPSPRIDGSTNVDYQIFRKVQIAANGANDANAGTWIRPFIFWNHSTQSNQVLNGNFVDANGKRELNIETSCSSCHTVGTYKNNTNLATHQTDVGSQWKNSAHGTRNDPAWAEFTANPPAYIQPSTGTPYPVGSHVTPYPYDMSKSTSKDFACKKCHNGISSIDYQENVQGTADARVVWGDELATCITCHDTHPRSDLGVVVNDMNIRKPVKMTKYTFSGAPAAFKNFSGNVFLDRRPVPAQALTATSVICIFCHQGRESGYTLFGTKLSTGTVPTGSFFNSHYLGTAAMLWGDNAYEYANKTYSVNAPHQSTNCAGCHMNRPTGDNLVAGHTWIVNPDNCTACHSSISTANGVTAASLQDPTGYLAGNGIRPSGDSNNYTGDADGATISIATATMRLEQKLILLLASQGIFYDDTTYPYFFTKTSSDATRASNTAWTLPQLKAAFNLSFIIKGLPSAGPGTGFVTISTTPFVDLPNTSSALVPNISATVHNYKYNIQLLQDSIADLSGQGANVYQAGGLLAGAVRPSTANDRTATSYNPAGIDQPYPNLQ